MGGGVAGGVRFWGLEWGMADGKLEVLYSFREAERRDLHEMWAMTPDERMILIEELRRSWYGATEDESAFPGVLEVFRRE